MGSRDGGAAEHGDTEEQGRRRDQRWHGSTKERGKWRPPEMGCRDGGATEPDDTVERRRRHNQRRGGAEERRPAALGSRTEVGSGATGGGSAEDQPES